MQQVSAPATADLPSPGDPKPANDGSMADRYYAMAEAMNTRGAMELAVPFYRQAIALLLAERDALRRENGTAVESSALPADTLHGLLEAAQAWDDHQPPAAPAEAPPEAPAPIPLEQRIGELAEELSATTATQVLAGLNALGQEAGGLPVDGLALQGKAQLLLGERAAALQSFETALALAPDRAELRINCGAARLANGLIDGALELLRGVLHEGLETFAEPTRSALLRNLSAAESQAGHLGRALQLRKAWLELDPEAVPLERWLAWADPGLKEAPGSEARIAAIELLQSLHQAAPEERRVMEALATALEEQGDYRAASLLYRELLRPAMLKNLQQQTGTQPA